MLRKQGTSELWLCLTNIMTWGIWLWWDDCMWCSYSSHTMCVGPFYMHINHFCVSTACKVFLVIVIISLFWLVWVKTISSVIWRSSHFLLFSYRFCSWTKQTFSRRRSCTPGDTWDFIFLAIKVHKTQQSDDNIFIFNKTISVNYYTSYLLSHCPWNLLFAWLQANLLRWQKVPPRSHKNSASTATVILAWCWSLTLS